jgi:hypothetical protein
MGSWFGRSYTAAIVGARGGRRSNAFSSSSCWWQDAQNLVSIRLLLLHVGIVCMLASS